jgi:diaminohydroxyphosphoribosylaminopyrimidine deaminase/5-amino-6-(5-phosphoribosylamino)uracil reductase
MRREAYRLNEDYFWSVVHKRSWVTLKLALTLDGRIADSRGESRWITSRSSRSLVHDMRRCHAAVAIGSGTLRVDDPLLTVRHVHGSSPVRVVFCSQGAIPARSRIAATAGRFRTIVVRAGGQRGARLLQRNGLEHWHTGEESPSRALKVFLKLAFKEGLTSILVEGGQRLASLFLENRLVNRVCLFYGNRILGSGLASIAFGKALPLGESVEIGNVEVHQLGSDVMLSGTPRWRPARA